MLSLRNHLISVSGIAVLLLSSFLLLSVTPWQVPHRVQTSLDAAFTSQFDGLQRLVLSLLQSQSQVQSLRVDSVALEDLSYALTVTPQGFPDDDVRQRIHTLSQEVAAVAALVQRLYVEVDVFVHLATATSHAFGKVLERQPHWLPRYFCQKLQLCVFARRRNIMQFHLTLQNHLDVLSNAIQSPASLAITLMEACRQLQLHADATVSTIALQADVPIGQGCLPLLMLWDRSDPDGAGFSTSSRNAGALQSFCADLAHVERQVNNDIASIRALQEVLTALRRVQSTGVLIDLDPSLPKRLYENIDSTLRLRSKGGKGETRPRTVTVISGLVDHIPVDGISRKELQNGS